MRTHAVLLLLLAISGCASLPEPYPKPLQHASETPKIVGTRGPLSRTETTAVLAKLGIKPDDADLLRSHLAIEKDIADSPLITGNDVRLLRDGEPTFSAMFHAIKSARHTLNLEYFIFDDIKSHGESLGDLLVAKRQEGVAINVLYDDFGSASTSTAFFDRLKSSGVQLVRFNPINPVTLPAANHRDHRKILVADGSTAIVGGVNMSASYESSRIRRSAGEPQTPDNLHWHDIDLLIRGPAAAGLQALFLQHWQEQKGPALAPADYFAKPAPQGNEVVRVIGSTPSKDLPRYYLTMLSAINSADKEIYLSAAYFVPTRLEKQYLMDAAKRGVDVRLLLPGISDSQKALEVQHSHYEDLLEAGVKIYEARNEVLHAKAVTIDGVWTIVGSSNFDYRSVLFNDEVDVVVLGQETALELQQIFKSDLKSAKHISLEEWKKRPVLQTLTDHVARFLEEML